MKHLNLILVLLVFIVCPTRKTNAQWVQTNGPNDWVSSFVLKGTNLFAGTYGSGVFLTTNNGTSWTAVDSGLRITNVTSLAASGTNLFAGTSGGVFLSTNNGTSWVAVDNGLTNTSVTSLAISGRNLFAGTTGVGGGVFHSTNNGTTWTVVNSGLPSGIDISALAVSDTNLFAGTYGNGVFLSTNNGTSWAAVDSGLMNTPIVALAARSINLFAGASGIGSLVFLSTNNGMSWVAIGSGLENATCHEVNAFAFSGNNIFVGTGANGTGNGVFLSTNNGTSWNAVNSGLPEGTYIDALAVNDTNLFAGTWGIGVCVWKRPLSEMITAVKDKNNDFPTNFSLQQNYPNPFNPTTTINYSVPKACVVTIKVYDVLGREVVTLVNEEKPVGNYIVQFNGNKLTSGIYYYRIEVVGYDGERFIATKKMVLLK